MMSRHLTNAGNLDMLAGDALAHTAVMAPAHGTQNQQSGMACVLAWSLPSQHMRTRGHEGPAGDSVALFFSLPEW